MVITDSTQIGQILCDHLPRMANDYFQYCSCRSQANKYLQIKIDSSEQFSLQLKFFQDLTGGLSLNGFLTKPIQRVTRYPLLIEKILKHTSTDHFDYHAIQQSLECARQLNERINQRISEQESSTRLDWLQQHLLFGSDDNNSDGYLFDELLKLNSLTKYHRQRQLLLHGLVMKVDSKIFRCQISFVPII
jgi:intersectin